MFPHSGNRNTILLAISSGLLLTGSFPKFGFFPVAWVALVPLLMAVRNLSTPERFRMGMVAGLVHYLTLTYWLIIAMQTYGGMNLYASIGVLFLLSAYLALYTGGFACLLGLLAPTPFRCLLVAPTLWIALEFIRAKALTGFPWELLGYSQYKALWVIQISDIFGVYGVSFLVVTVNAGLFLVWLSLKGQKWRHQTIPPKTATALGLTTLLLLGTAVGYGARRMNTIHRDSSNARRIRAAVIQGNIAQDAKWDQAFKNTTIETYLRLSRNAVAEAPDLVIWPETATPFYLLRDTQSTRRILTDIKTTGAFFLIGSPAMEESEADRQFYNSAYMISPGGGILKRYDKQHLVPFGEYVPLKKWLWFVDKMVMGMGDFSPGRSSAVIPWENGLAGVQVCYEMIFPSLSRRAVKDHADLLVNITNDAWYERSSAPYQHFSMAVLRAVENRRSVVRAANTGISGFVDPSGRIIARTPLFEEAALTRPIPLLETRTLYTRFGDWLPVAGGIWLILLLFKDNVIIRFNKKRTEKENTYHVP